jgi:hypothetical protein
VIISLNSINQMIFVMERQRVLYDVGNKILNKLIISRLQRDIRILLLGEYLNKREEEREMM